MDKPGFVAWHMNITIVNKQFYISMFDEPLTHNPLRFLCPFKLMVLFPRKWQPSGIYTDINPDWGFD